MSRGRPRRDPRSTTPISERDRDAPDRPGETPLVHRRSSIDREASGDGRAVAAALTGRRARRRARRGGRRSPGARCRARRSPGRTRRPSSVTSNVRLPFACASRTVAVDASAYFATFWSASRQEKYTAASDLLRVAADPVRLDHDGHRRTSAPAPRAPPRGPGRRAAADRSLARGPAGPRAPRSVSALQLRRASRRALAASFADQRVREPQLHARARRAAAARRRGCCARAAGAPRPAPRRSAGARRGAPRSARTFRSTSPACAARSRTSRSFDGFIGSFAGIADRQRTEQLALVADLERRPRRAGARRRPRHRSAGIASDGHAAVGRSSAPHGSHTGRIRTGRLAEHLRHPRQDVLGRVRLARPVRRTRRAPRTASPDCRRRGGSRSVRASRVRRHDGDARSRPRTRRAADASPPRPTAPACPPSTRRADAHEREQQHGQDRVHDRLLDHEVEVVEAVLQDRDAHRRPARRRR